VVTIGLAAFVLLVLLDGNRVSTPSLPTASAAPAAAKPRQPATTPASAPVAAKAPAAPATPPAPPPEAAAALPPAPAATAAAAAAQPAPAPEPAARPAPATPPRRAPRPDPYIQAWVQKVKLSGIRMGPQPKALINDRVYLVGDIVNIELELRLSAIKSRTLEFEDAAGNLYELPF
jgi:hypothetical protein